MNNLTIHKFVSDPGIQSHPAAQVPGKSLLDATPTEEQAISPLVPVNLSPRKELFIIFCYYLDWLFDSFLDLVR